MQQAVAVVYNRAPAVLGNPENSVRTFQTVVRMRSNNNSSTKK